MSRKKQGETCLRDQVRPTQSNITPSPNKAAELGGMSAPAQGTSRDFIGPGAASVTFPEK